MSKSLEIERKFVVQFPQSWSELAELFDDLVDVKRITQTYLEPEGKEPAARVRKTVQGLTGDTDTEFHYNKKKAVKPGVREEEEREISKKEYENYLKKPHPDLVTIEKTRFVFKYNDQIFELDVFKGRLKGIAILEIELEDIDQPVELPPFLMVIKEVTKEEKFNNFNLAKKHLHE